MNKPPDAAATTVTDVHIGEPLTSAVIYRAFVEDFRAAWDSIAAAKPSGRFNFGFALHAFLFLEWCSRTAHQADNVRLNFVTALNGRDPKYFAPLPRPWMSRQRPAPWFPAQSPAPTNQTWLWAAFDVVRNEIGHVYQQPDIEIGDGWLRFSITGPTKPARSSNDPRPADHLRPSRIPTETEALIGRGAILIVRIYPDVLLEDISAAADAAGLANLPPAPWNAAKQGATADEIISAARGGRA